MPASMPAHRFEQLVKSKGCSIVPSGKHHQIVDAAGKRIMTFAIAHKGGGKREVKSFYVKRFTALVP